MQIANISSFLNLADIPSRILGTVSDYMLSLALPADNHSQANAARMSGKNDALYSRMLQGHLTTSETVLNRSSRRRISRLMKNRKPLTKGAPWQIAIIIDATLHERSSTRVENSQKFNHGRGYVTGHQWTNIVISINGQLVPLPPIPFYTKNECKRRKIEYLTEVDSILKLFRSLDLTEILGKHDPGEIVFLLDSGYDVKRLQSYILDSGWDFVCSLKATRTVSSCRRPEVWVKIASYLKRGRKSKRSIRIATYRGNKKRMQQHLTKLREGYLRGVSQKMQLVSSIRPKDKRRKFLACSNHRVDVKVILCAYKRRWDIEMFHRDLKSHLGLEDAGVKQFDSLHSHVHWVYCTYNYLKEISPETAGIRKAQILLQSHIRQKEANNIIQLVTRFGGVEQVKTYLHTVIDQSKKAASF